MTSDGSETGAQQQVEIRLWSCATAKLDRSLDQPGRGHRYIFLRVGSFNLLILNCLHPAQNNICFIRRFPGFVSDFRRFSIRSEISAATGLGKGEFQCNFLKSDACLRLWLHAIPGKSQNVVPEFISLSIDCGLILLKPML